MCTRSARCVHVHVLSTPRIKPRIRKGGYRTLEYPLLPTQRTVGSPKYWVCIAVDTPGTLEYWTFPAVNALQESPFTECSG